MKATDGNNDLQNLSLCTISIPGAADIVINNLPDISDSKSAAYNDEAVIGRAIPLKTYSHSENRVINTKLHFFIRKKDDAAFNLRQLRAIQSAVYPQQGDPYTPPPVCQIKCGNLLSLKKPLCVVLLSYNVTFPTDVAWWAGEGDGAYCPYKFDVDCSWQVVYEATKLPYANRIFLEGR